MRHWKLFAALAVVGAVAVGGYKYSRAGYESPDYRSLSKDGPFEVRDYPPMVLASTPMASPDPQEGDGFMRLFRYISGANAGEEKIAMTVPVFMTGDEDDGRRMSFVTPRAVAAEGAPAADDPRVEIETMPAGRFVAYRYSGTLEPARMAEAEAELAAWVREQGLETVGAPIYAGYDPPFTPSFLRRNEVLMRLAETTTAADGTPGG